MSFDIQNTSLIKKLQFFTMGNLTYLKKFQEYSENKEYFIGETTKLLVIQAKKRL